MYWVENADECTCRRRKFLLQPPFFFCCTLCFPRGSWHNAHARMRLGLRDSNSIPDPRTKSHVSMNIGSPSQVQTVMALPFTSRRSPVICRNGCVACSQPLAAEIGLQVLRRGGNAADAAVAVAAALNVTEPCSTGIGGDCFCLFYDAGSKEVKGINGR